MPGRLVVVGVFTVGPERFIEGPLPDGPRLGVVVAPPPEGFAGAGAGFAAGAGLGGGLELFFLFCAEREPAARHIAAASITAQRI